MTDGGLDLATLSLVLQRLRRRPRDRALRVTAAQQVTILADFDVSATGGPDRLLTEAIAGAKLLRRALERANRTEVASDSDIAAVNSWIDGLHGTLLKIIERSA